MNENETILISRKFYAERVKGELIKLEKYAWDILDVKTSGEREDLAQKILSIKENISQWKIRC